MNGSRPTTSVVIVNYNGGERALACLRSVVEFGASDDIIVVDNGSEDGSCERMLRACPAARAVRLSGNPGPATARNQGLATARHARVLLLDSDTRLTASTVPELLHAGTLPEATIVCPRLLLAPAARAVQCDGAAPHFVGTLALRNAGGDPGVSPPAHEVDGLISACLLVEREPVLADGGFDESFFFYFEDLEFGLRMRLLGHRIVCAPRAVVLHDRGCGYAALSFRGEGVYPTRRAYYTMRNRLMTVAICFHRRTILVLLPALAAYEAATLALALSRGWGGAWLRAWASLARNRRSLAAARRRVQTGRRLADRDVLVGGALPLADGVIASPVIARAVNGFSRGLDLYWRLVRGAVH